MKDAGEKTPAFRGGSRGDLIAGRVVGWRATLFFRMQDGASFQEQQAAKHQWSETQRECHPPFMLSQSVKINTSAVNIFSGNARKRLPVALTNRINRGIMSASSAVKDPRKVAYLGPEGTFSHLVALRRYPKKPGLPCATITEVFHAVRSGVAEMGIVPIENSSGGTITETVDLLIEQAGHLAITEELPLDVRLALLGRAGTAFAKLRAVYSHVMPLRHHREWIREHLPNVRMVESSSTADAAKKAALSATSAALAAPSAAALYGLSILKFPVRPEAVNVTHFFVITSAVRAPSSLPEQARCKTAIVAALPQTSGSLHRFLGPFARAGVNLCRIVSRPVPGQPETYVFYLEVEGSAEEAKVKKALAGARRLSVRLEIPGSYPTRPRYRSPAP